MGKVRVKTLLHRKLRHLRDLNELSLDMGREPKWLEVDQEVTITRGQFTLLKEDFTEEVGWLEGKDGILLVTDGEESLVVDPQGYGYPRYVGLVFDKEEIK